MFSTLLSLAFGVAGFLVFYFGVGAAWEFSLIVAGITSIGMWLGDRATTRAAVNSAPTGSDGTPDKCTSEVHRAA
jgi:hypothetical protein